MRKKGQQALENNSNSSEGQAGEIVTPLSNMSSLLVSKLRNEKLPQAVLPSDLPLAEKVQELYVSYELAFLENKSLNIRLTEMIEDRNRLAEKFNTVKRTRSTEDAVKRKRRYARDIERLFYCPIEKCNRGYGSEGSLSHHVRLKHIDFYQNGKYQIFIQKHIDQMVAEKKKAEEEHLESETPVKRANREAAGKWARMEEQAQGWR